jgi:hypothetical protein
MSDVRTSDLFLLSLSLSLSAFGESESLQSERREVRSGSGSAWQWQWHVAVAVAVAVAVRGRRAVGDWGSWGWGLETRTPGRRRAPRPGAKARHRFARPGCGHRSASCWCGLYVRATCYMLHRKQDLPLITRGLQRHSGVALEYFQASWSRCCCCSRGEQEKILPSGLADSLFVRVRGVLLYLQQKEHPGLVLADVPRITSYWMEGTGASDAASRARGVAP